MKFIFVILLAFLSLSAFADRPVQSARMGKVGTLHPKAWRISEDPDVEGVGKVYSFEVSIFKGDIQIDFFRFELNEGAKNTKKSQFSVQGDLAKENFGNEVALEFISKSENQIKLSLELDSKVLYSISYDDGKYKAKIILAEFAKECYINIDKPLNIHLNKDTLVEIKATEK